MKEGKFHDLETAGTVVSVDQMRRSDAYTIEHFVPSRELMYRAADGVFRAYDGWQGRKIAIVVGGGNNGGDGFALAGILKKAGMDPVIYEVSDKPSEDGSYYRDIARELGVRMDAFEADTDLSGYDVIVDCVLGTGFKGEVRGKAGDAIRAINKAGATGTASTASGEAGATSGETGAYVISVDINSGMNGDTGEGALAVKSDLTVSIGYYKQGQFKGDAEKYIGELTNADIGIVLVE